MDHPATTTTNCSLQALIIIHLLIWLAFLGSLPFPATSSMPQLASAAWLSTSSPPIFIFGASLVDAGENAAAMPRRSNADFDPYGSDYFGKPVGRWSNGRTFMDFITEELGYGHIPAYLRSIGSDFTHGVNFASSGSTAANTTAVGNNSGGLFCLLVQVDQFRDFQDTIMSSGHYGLEQKARLRQRFSDAIYFFETGNNDYNDAKVQFSESLDINATVATTIAAMKVAFQAMYGLGARTFIVLNATPTGCSPGGLRAVGDDEELDENNCNALWTDIDQAHNKRLSELLDELRDNYPAGEWVLFDAYSIFMDGYLNPSNYGILYPFRACCGSGGTYNVANVLCGMDAQYINGTLVEWTKCENPKLYLIWDFLHPVESFAYYIAQGVLNGTHLFPSFSLKERVQLSNFKT